MSRKLSLVLFWVSLAFSGCSSLTRDEKISRRALSDRVRFINNSNCLSRSLPQVPQIHCVAESLECAVSTVYMLPRLDADC